MNIKELVKKVIMFFCAIFIHVDKKSALFSSYWGINYSDSPRYISEKMKELDPSVNIYWIMRKKADTSVIPDYVNIIYKGTFKSLITMLKCKVWVFNEVLFKGIYKRKTQIYVQTYHGDRVPKKVLLDEGIRRINKKRIKVGLIEPKTMTYGIAGSEIGEKTFRTAFHFMGEVINVGMPRNDRLVNLDNKLVKRIKEKLNLIGYNILLYAPTFRDNCRDNQGVDLDFRKIISILEETTKESWRILVRKHKATNVLNYNKYNFVIDVSNYNEMAELLMISDVLISDYSSSVGDYVLLDRPIILYQPDYIEYQKECREFKFDLRDMGFLYADNQDELCSYISRMGDIDFMELNKEIRKRLTIHESGKSSEIIASRLLSEMKR